MNTPRVVSTSTDSPEQSGNFVSPPILPQSQPEADPLETTMITTTTTTTVLPSRSRDERMKQMREKREQQRQKRLNQKKMGLAIADANSTGDTESVPIFSQSVESPQYSPSISHDEVSEESGAASNTSSGVLNRRLMQAPSTIGVDDTASATEEDDDDEAEEGGEKGDDWGERWSDIEDFGSAKFGTSFGLPEPPSTVIEPHPVSSMNGSSTTNPKASKLVLKSKTSDKKEDSNEGGKRVGESPGVRRGNLSTKEDMEPAPVEDELDLFADMAPKFPSSSAPLFPGSPGLHRTTSNSSNTGPISASVKAVKEVEEVHRPSSSSLMYQPQSEVPDNLLTLEL